MIDKYTIVCCLLRKKVAKGKQGVKHLLTVAEEEARAVGFKRRGWGRLHPGTPGSLCGGGGGGGGG
jgi:hypothetical protein